MDILTLWPQAADCLHKAGTGAKTGAGHKTKKEKAGSV